MKVCNFQGKVRGSVHSSFNGRFYAQFLAIPYAEPPLGDLRFARPRPSNKNWNETVREADKQPPKCVQLNQVTGDPMGTEDCLVLNIYVSSKSKNVSFEMSLMISF